MRANARICGNAWKDLQWGDISWSNYRSTDDGNGTDPGEFFPVNAGIFQMAYAPAPRFAFVNTLGLPTDLFVGCDGREAGHVGGRRDVLLSARGLHHAWRAVERQADQRRLTVRHRPPLHLPAGRIECPQPSNV
jgi:hypothetical protein